MGTDNKRSKKVEEKKKKVQSNNDSESSEEQPKDNSNKAKKTEEKAQVPQKKNKVDSNSDSDSNESEKPAQKKAAQSGSESSDEEPKSKKSSRKNSTAADEGPAVSDEHDGKLELFVQGLSFDTTDESLQAFFEPYGELTKCKLLSGKGKAFIEYGEHAHARKALQNTNEQTLDNRTIWVEFSGQAAGGYKPGGGGDDTITTLFCGNLGFRTEQSTIEEFFSQAGTVKEVRIALGEDQRPRGFAHIEFGTHEEACEAMKLAGQEIDGRAIRLDLSASRKSGGGRGGGRGGGFGGGRGGGRGFGGGRGGGRGGDRGGRGGGFRGGGRGGGSGWSR